jgi:hypothetical protein
MELKPVEIKSFLEWRAEHLEKKKKEKKDESGSIQTSGEIGVKNDEGHPAGNHSEIPIQNVHVFPSP